MTRPQIEHPLSIGIVNKQILDTVTIAYQVALDLAAKGFSVKGIESNTQYARILLYKTGQCKALPCAVKKRGRDTQGHYQVYAASINGCEVNWQERSAI